MTRELDAAPKIEFPCERYLIKVVGDAHPEYQQFVAGVLVKYDPAVTVESFSEN
ncbi:MAG: putative lipoic acid-binding regulatory protein, partial [Reinekea sp.]